MNLPAVLLACLALVAPFAQAAAIYQWVDDQGRVQFSDTVPERYRRAATEVQVEQFKAAPKPEVPPNRTMAKPLPVPRDGINPRTAAPSAGISAAPAGAAAPSALRDSRNGKTDCATLQREYAASQACFAPFVTAFGSVKAEAFEKCTPMVDPSPQCGVPRLP